MTLDRQCSSGLMALSVVSNAIRVGEMDMAVAGGVESVSLVQNDRMNVRASDPWITAHRPDLYVDNGNAEIVAARYGVTRGRRTNMRLDRTGGRRQRNRMAGLTTKSYRCQRDENKGSRYR